MRNSSAAPAGAAMPAESGRILFQFVLVAAAGHAALRLVAPRAAAQPYAVAMLLTAIGLACAILSGAVASGLGYAIWYAVLPGLTPAQGASVQLSVPVITALAGALVLGEAISLRLSISSLAILGGIALVFGSQERAPSSR